MSFFFWHTLYIDIIMVCLRKAIYSSFIYAIIVWIPFIYINVDCIVYYACLFLIDNLKLYFVYDK